MANLYETTISSRWVEDIRGDDYVATIPQGVITEVQPPLNEDEIAIAAQIGMYGGIGGKRVVQREATDEAPAATVIRHEMYYSERPSETRERAERQVSELTYKLAETRGSGVEVLSEGERVYAVRLGALASK